MNKSELIDYMATKHSCTKTEAEKVIDMFTDTVVSSFKDGHEVTLIGFGNFFTTKVEQREGRNPKTGEPLTIPAYVQPKFRPGQKLKDACNKTK